MFPANNNSGISTIPSDNNWEHENAHHTIYTLYGKRVGHAGKGVFIIDGKKTIK